MRLAEIHEGHEYLVHVVVPAGPATGRVRTTARATVVATNGRTVEIETTEPTCVNLDQFTDRELTGAMANGQLRYEPRPVRRVVKAGAVVRPYTPEAG